MFIFILEKFYFHLFRLNKKMGWPGFELTLKYSFLQSSVCIKKLFLHVFPDEQNMYHLQEMNLCFEN